jgi:fluoride exporter
METWLKVVALSVGGSLGVNARYWLGVWMSRWASPQFPWATFTINVSGSFLIGFLTVALARWSPHPNARLLFITGFLGGYTTFSTYENESLSLWERGETLLMGANLIGSVVAGLLAVLMGTALARGLSADRPTATGSRAADAMATRVLDPAESGHARSNSAESDRLQAIGGQSGADEGSSR